MTSMSATKGFGTTEMETGGRRAAGLQTEAPTSPLLGKTEVRAATFLTNPSQNSGAEELSVRMELLGRKRSQSALKTSTPASPEKH